MYFKVISAGKCVVCGREIKIKATKKNKDKFPNIFFCPECEKQRLKKSEPHAESEDKE